jgi:Holliday junction resolvase
MGRVVALAKGRGWLAYHTHDSRHSPEGFPDLVLCNGQATLFAELKAARGKLSLAQQQWVGLLDHAGQAVYVWRPGDWAQIVALLTAAPTQRLGDRDE